VPIEELPLLDQWMLQRTAALIDEVTEHFESFEFYRFFQALQNFCVVDLSNFYLDIAKDRLYVSGASQFRRRSCQTVLALVVERLAGLIAPVLCHMAEDIWQNLPYPVAERSVFDRGWPLVPAGWRSSDDQGGTAVVQLRQLRAQVNRQLEDARAQGAIGSSLEAQVRLEPAAGTAGEPWRAALAVLEASAHLEVDNLVDWLLVSKLQVGGEPLAAPLAEATEAGLTVRIARAEGHKCERCWHIEPDVGQHTSHPLLCGRCVGVLAGVTH
jgi:isoleucyl-tRNA synthetase